MKASLMTRLERLEKTSSVIDEFKRIDKIVLRGMGTSTEYVLWTRPGFVDDAETPVESFQ